MDHKAYEELLAEFSQPSNDKDLFDILLRFHQMKLKESPVEDPSIDDADLAIVRMFIEDCRDFLTRNPPVSVYMVENGLGLRLQLHQMLPFLKFVPRKPIKDAVAITRPDTAPGMEGVIRHPAGPITGRP
jgi:hypothetical protein